MATAVKTLVVVDLEVISQVIRRGLQTQASETLDGIRRFDRGQSTSHVVWPLNNKKMLLDFGLLPVQLNAISASIIQVLPDKTRTDKEPPRRVHYYILGPEEQFAPAGGVRVAHDGSPMKTASSGYSFEIAPGEYHKFEVGHNGVLYVLQIEEL